MNKKFDKLQKENEKIRQEINNCLDFTAESFKKSIWDKINLLIENEIEQEELCE